MHSTKQTGTKLPSGFDPFALSSCIALALLAGCGKAQLPISAPGAIPQHAEMATAHGLGNLAAHDSDGGKYPQAPLVDVGGILYGTTTNGGAFHGRKMCRGGCGIVFSMTTRGVPKLLHSFGSSGDGQYPDGGLVGVDGTLYGTTSAGGAFGGGTVFSITPDGVEKVLHSFGSGTDGADPRASLLAVRGTLYGTTASGGAYGLSSSSFNPVCIDYSAPLGCGTVFSITTSGVEKVLHSFGNGDDGQHPYAGLVHFGTGTTLYGTTIYGGTVRHPLGHGRSGGTVFSITTSGVEKVLYSLGHHYGGIWPLARLLPVNGALYGTTSQGGAHDSGTVFVVTTDGKGRIIHSFSNLYRDDGNFPDAGLTDVKGTLYSTTTSGGACDVGTVFSITTTGAETVLHSFYDGYICRGQIDGAVPMASLTNVDGVLYGTTEYGGGFPKVCHSNGSIIGCGTVFSITTTGQIKIVRRFH